LSAPLLVQPWPRDSAQLLALADLADTVQRDEVLASQLDALSKSALSAAQQQTKVRLYGNHLLRQAAQQIAQGDAAAAQAVLQGGLASLPADSRLQSALADALEAGGDIRAALAMTEARVQRQPQDADARLDLARLLAADGDRAAARRQVEQALQLAGDDDLPTRLAAVRRLAALSERAQARQLLAQLAADQPGDSRLILQDGRLSRAENRPALALSLFQQAAQDPQRRAEAQREIDTLRASTAPYLASAVQSRSKPGDAGLSKLQQWEAPLELRWPQGVLGRWFVQLDPVRLDAGTIVANQPDASERFGQSRLLAPQGLESNQQQRARGVAIGLGWQSEAWRWDIGSTPLGFAVQDVVGGVRWRDELPWGQLQLALSRRPLTSSLLSFAGARDPVSGEVWGGVRQNGLDLRWSNDFGRYSANASLNLSVLTGRNLPSNPHAELRLALDRTLIDRPNQFLSVGAAVNLWHYQRDLSAYTFGQGGYYSPQAYASLSLPIEYEGHAGRWAWSLRGALGASVSRSTASPWYPGRPELQAATGNPLFTESRGHGISRSLRAAIEYRASATVRWGLEGALDRSAFYTPNYLGLYLRYDLGKPADAPRFPDNPLTPYSRF
uniref:cellulose synthase subunit BcsC-related outer membrane protein n=1 Tax=Chitinimonas sp. TaxID=1934313 RepID=UPI0035B30DE9